MKLLLEVQVFPESRPFNSIIVTFIMMVNPDVPIRHKYNKQTNCCRWERTDKLMFSIRREVKASAAVSRAGVSSGAPRGLDVRRATRQMSPILCGVIPLLPLWCLVENRQTLLIAPVSRVPICFQSVCSL